MSQLSILTLDQQEFLKETFGSKIVFNAPLARLTSTQVGGNADALLTISSSNEMIQASHILWKTEIPFRVIGAGSNILVSDDGVRGIVILNQARKVLFRDQEDEVNVSVWAEAGAKLSALARQAARRGLAGLEWACGIPGTLGGAIVGNAGAHGSDIASNLIMAEILHHTDNRIIENWLSDRFEFTYRGSILKKGNKNLKNQPNVIILSSTLKLEKADQNVIETRIQEFQAKRRKTQPPGASMGSIFKNPPGDYAGRLIDLAGLKGLRIGNTEVSSIHGNFFINNGGANAREFMELINKVQQVVYEKFGIKLELEIELVGDWSQGDWENG